MENKADVEKMNEAAGVAEIELSNIPDEHLSVVCDWFLRHYMKAGHKRLGRIIVQNAKRLAGASQKGR